MPSSRKEAKAAGATRYFTGEPCPQGHIAPRKTSAGSCVECGRLTAARWHGAHKTEQVAYRKAYYDANAEDMRRRSRDWMAANRDRKRENQRAWDDANRERKNANRRRWCEENPEAIRAINTRSYINNINAIRQVQKRWRAANPEKLVAISERRRALIAGSGGRGVTAEDIIALKRRQTKCVDCGRKFGANLKATLDHIMPISKGGAHDRSNVELRCKSCNSRKRSRDPIEHAKTLGRLL